MQRTQSLNAISCTYLIYRSHTHSLPLNHITRKSPLKRRIRAPQPLHITLIQPRPPLPLLLHIHRRRPNRNPNLLRPHILQRHTALQRIHLPVLERRRRQRPPRRGARRHQAVHHVRNTDRRGGRAGSRSRTERGGRRRGSR